MGNDAGELGSDKTVMGFVNNVEKLGLQELRRVAEGHSLQSRSIKGGVTIKKN